MEKIAYIGSQCIDFVDGVYYILTKSGHDLISYSPDDKSIKYIGSIDDGREVFITSAVYKHTIIYFSYYGDRVCEYNTKENVIRYVPLNPLIDSRCVHGFSVAQTYKDGVFLTGNISGQPLAYYNALTKNMENKWGWAKQFHEKYGIDPYASVYSKICVADGSVWMPLNKKDVIMQYSINDDKCFFWELPRQDINYYTIDYNDGFFYLTGDKECIIRWDKSDNDIECFDKFPEGFKYENDRGYTWNGMFFGGVEHNEKLLYAPLNCNMFIELDVNTGTISKIREISHGTHSFALKKLNNGKIYTEINYSAEHVVSESYILTDNFMPFYIDSNAMIMNANKADVVGGEDGSLFLKESFPGMMGMWIEGIVNC